MIFLFTIKITFLFTVPSLCRSVVFFASHYEQGGGESQYRTPKHIGRYHLQRNVDRAEQPGCLQSFLIGGDVRIHARHVALGKCVYHRFASVEHISVVYEPEVDVVCHGGKQRGKYVHENGEYPRMQEANAASAYVITIHP